MIEKILQRKQKTEQQEPIKKQRNKNPYKQRNKNP
jgi:hypothetical protein